MVRRIAIALGLLFSTPAFAQGYMPEHAGWGGSYRPPQYFPPPPPPPVIDLDRYHAGYGGSAPTPEQLRSRAARSAWESISFVRGRLTQGSTMPSRFPGGPDGFLATVAWEMSRPGMSSAFQSAYGRADRGITLRFPYNGNDVELFIPGTQLQQAVDALRDAASGNLGNYRFYEPPHVPPQIGAPRQAPLGLRLFGPINGTETGLFWTALGVANRVNPNASLSPHSGWIGPRPQQRSAAPSLVPDFFAAANPPSGWNGARRDGSLPTVACAACSSSGTSRSPGAGIDRSSM